MNNFTRQSALTFFLAILLAGCSSIASQNPVQPSTATPLENKTPVSVNPCFESGCHSELHVNDGPYKHQPYVDEQCLDCHVSFHTESTQRLYTQSDIELCYRCHPLATLGNTHPVGEGIIDPNTNQMMTCTSTCHYSHTAPYPYLLSLSASGELCVSCHQELISQ
jgi:predicted CXXCH cytochrome family protein